MTETFLLQLLLGLQGPQAIGNILQDRTSVAKILLGIGHPGLASTQFGLGILQILIQTAFFGSQIPFLNTAFLQLFLPTLQLMPGPFHGGHPVILFELLNLFRFAGLVLQLLHGTVDLKKNILNSRQVGFGILQTSHGFFLADFVFGDPGGLFK